MPLHAIFLAVSVVQALVVFAIAAPVTSAIIAGVFLLFNTALTLVLTRHDRGTRQRRRTRPPRPPGHDPGARHEKRRDP